MFDRVLDISTELQKRGISKPLSETAVMLYQDEGQAAAVGYLVSAGGMSEEPATKLVTEIEHRYIRANRLIAFFYSGILVLWICLLVFALLSTLLLMAAVCTVLLLRRAVILFRFVRNNRFTEESRPTTGRRPRQTTPGH